MSTVISRWGNSLAIRIPKAVADQIQVEEGTPVSISISGDSIVITPQKRKNIHLTNF